MRRGILALGLLLPMFGRAAQLVDLTVQMEINSWAHWFLRDQRSHGGGDSIFDKPATIHCVIGTNSWVMDGDFVEHTLTKLWFTGTNLIEENVITQALAEAEAKRTQSSGINLLAMGQQTPVGEKWTNTYPTIDGNPGRPSHEADLMHLRGNLCWLALCSGPALQREGRKIFPPGALWKQLVSAPTGFTDKTSVFDDGLGLPRSVELFTPELRRIFQYQVRQTTNFNGWVIPLEFYGVQYRPVGTTGWEVDVTFKGKVTGIGVGREPQSREPKEGRSKR